MSNNNKIPVGWKEITLGKFMEFKNGVNADKEAYGQGTKFVNVMDIFRKSFLDKNDIGGSVQITEKQLSEYSVVSGDILFNRTSETPEEIAFASVYMGNEIITFGGFVIRGRQTKELLSPLFSGYFFKNEQIRKEMIRRSQGAIRANIGQKDLNKVIVLIPPISEQKRIAQILQEWDAAIEKTESLITAKKKQFGWLQNHLMKQMERTCKEEFLGKVASLATKEAITSANGKILLTVKLHCLGLRPNTRQKPKITKKGRPYYERKAGEFIIGRQNFHNGGFGIVPKKLDGYVASNAITSMNIDESKLDIDFLFFFFSRKDYYLRIGHIMDGTGQKELSDKQILKLPIFLPSLPEQKSIAHTLSTAQREITLLEQKAELYRTQKRSLMQKLLTGKWSVSG